MDLLRAANGQKGKEGVFTMNGEILPFPDKKYQIILADPPWDYNDKMKGHSFSLDHEYETQNLNWIVDLPVQRIADKNCVLFLWAVSPQLPEALKVMKAWGFNYVTVAFVWSKHTVNGKKVSNLGRWTMGNVEMCLLGRKGRPQRISRDVKQLIEAVRTKHSKKPEEIRERIVQLMGDLPRIELFARPPKDVLFGDPSFDGWDVWGNEC